MLIVYFFLCLVYSLNSFFLNLLNLWDNYSFFIILVITDVFSILFTIGSIAIAVSIGIGGEASVGVIVGLLILIPPCDKA